MTSPKAKGGLGVEIVSVAAQSLNITSLTVKTVVQTEIDTSDYYHACPRNKHDSGRVK